MKTKIGILGLGAVGGYVGGLLAEKYSGSTDTEILFMVRPHSVQNIKTNGLQLIFDDTSKTVHPDLVVSDATHPEKLDVLICCTKSYDLEDSLATYAPYIGQDTVIVPLYNGVDAFEKIRGLFPQALVCSACIYIVSFIQGPGVIRINGNKQIVHIGSDSIEKDRLLRVQKILTDAGIPCQVSENIQKTVWEKFLFISCIASLTSYLDISIGAIIENPEHSKLLQAMFLEFMEVAKAYGVELEEDLIHKSFERMATMPYASTSSMHNDYKKGGKTEYLSLTGYIVNLGNALRIDMPNFDRMLLGLEQRNTLH